MKRRRDGNWCFSHEQTIWYAGNIHVSTTVPRPQRGRSRGTISARGCFRAGDIADGSEIPHRILNLGGCTWSAGREHVVVRGVSRLLEARHDGGVSERARRGRYRRSPRVHLSHNVTGRLSAPSRIARNVDRPFNKLAVQSERVASSFIYRLIIRSVLRNKSRCLISACARCPSAFECSP